MIKCAKEFKATVILGKNNIRTGNINTLVGTLAEERLTEEANRMEVDRGGHFCINS